MVTVRPERPSDLPQTHAVHEASFPTDAEARLVSLLRAAGRLTLSLVAEADGTIVGHVAFSPVTTASGVVGIGLAPVAVLESYRRRGIAAELIKAGLAECKAAGFGWSVVLGEPAYYSRFGYRPALEIGLSDVRRRTSVLGPRVDPRCIACGCWPRAIRTRVCDRGVVDGSTRCGEDKLRTCC